MEAKAHMDEGQSIKEDAVIDILMQEYFMLQEKIDKIHDDFAAERKRRKISCLVERIYPAWRVLSDGFKMKYVSKLCRETQRYNLLKEGKPVPATAVLDFEASWDAHSEMIFEDLVRLVWTRPGQGALARLLTDEYRKFHIPHVLQNH